MLPHIQSEHAFRHYKQHRTGKWALSLLKICQHRHGSQVRKQPGTINKPYYTNVCTPDDSHQSRKNQILNLFYFNFMFNSMEMSLKIYIFTM